jgi:uncharacterized protein with ParB-like and HNH nuclease domain
MHAKDYSLNAVLKERQQWVIPVYQRHYAWKSDANGQLPKLWDDIRDRALQVLEGHKPSPHFVGAIIYSEPPNQPFGSVNRRFLVDGQQRISTFSLVLSAIKDVANQRLEPRIANAVSDYLFNAESDSMLEPAREKFKLWSSSYDRAAYVTVCDGGVEQVRERYPDLFYKNRKFRSPKDARLLSAFFFLVTEIETFIAEIISEGHPAEAGLNALLTGFLEGFQIVVVQLGADDDAQAIFASLNGNAEPLSAFDLIRNSIFHRANKNQEDEDSLYEGEWKRLEEPFWKTEVKQGRLKRPRTDHLIAHTLVAETAQDISVGNIANEYISFAMAREFKTVEAEVSSLLKYSDAYRRLEESRYAYPEFRIANFLRLWDLSVFHPIVMWFCVDELTDEEKLKAYHFIESYIVRRDICGLTRKNYNNAVPQMLRAAKSSDDPINAIRQRMNELEGDNSRMPSDLELVRSVESRALYGDDFTSKKLRYIFREIELHRRTKMQEVVSLDIEGLTVEHLMPRSWAKYWKLPNGESVPYEDELAESLAQLASGDSADVALVMSQLDNETKESVTRRNRSINLLGNLTIVTSSLNPSMGNNGWTSKRNALQKSLLTINHDVANEPEWNEDKILDRSRGLADRVNRIWPA